MAMHAENNPAAAVSEDLTVIQAADGYALSALWITPPAPTHAVLIQSGTGFPKEFYRHFARAGAARGAACLLYDYRGIAGSAPDDLSAMEMDYTDWGRLDVPAAIDALTARYPHLPTGHVGHSVGGHFLGFADNADRLQRHAFVCVGSGYWGKHFWTDIPKELFFWWVYGPALIAIKGYLPGGGLWGGTALPKGVFTTWRRWCHKADYYHGELAGRLHPHQFNAVTAPIRSFIYTDDPIANARTAPDMLAAYPQAPSELIHRAPAEFGLKSIGHAGLFRRVNAPAWTEIWDWTLEGR